MHQDFREFVADVERIGELRTVEGADPYLEIGAITEVAAGSPSCPMLLFDRIKGYPPGYRVLSNLLHTTKRLALAVGLPIELQGVPFLRAWKEKMRGLGTLPPVDVKEGPVMENIMTGKDVDLLRFPSPMWHEMDPGRYFGTGAVTVSRDPDKGWVDCGVFRLQLHDRTTLGIYISTGRNLKVIAEKYWSRGKNCPVAVCAGVDPNLFLMGGYPVPFGTSEYDVAGWLRGKPMEVIRGEVTGLPIPAFAEIALEGEIPPPHVESRPEGPFGEGTGYYASNPTKRTVIRVNRIMHRDDPILHGAPPMKPFPGLAHHGVNWRAANLWGELEKADISGVRGVWQYGLNMTVISLKQNHPGEAKRAAFVAAASRGLDLSRFIVVVDEDIDPSNFMEVAWAMSTRSDPAESIEIVRGRTVSGIDARIPPDQREEGNITMSQILIDACRPYHWRDQFPKVNEVSPELKAKTIEKWGHAIV